MTYKTPCFSSMYARILLLALILTALLPLSAFSQTTSQPPTTPSVKQTVIIPYEQSVVIVNSLKDYEALKKRYTLKTQQVGNLEEVIRYHTKKDAAQDSVQRTLVFIGYQKDAIIEGQKSQLTRTKGKLIRSRILNIAISLTAGTLTYLAITR